MGYVKIQLRGEEDPGLPEHVTASPAAAPDESLFSPPRVQQTSFLIQTPPQREEPRHAEGKGTNTSVSSEPVLTSDVVKSQFTHTGKHTHNEGSKTQTHTHTHWCYTHKHTVRKKFLHFKHKLTQKSNFNLAAPLDCIGKQFEYIYSSTEQYSLSKLLVGGQITSENHSPHTFREESKSG